MRKIQQFTDGAKVAKVYKNKDSGEFVVRFFNDGTYLTESDYFTDDKADATDTAKAEIARTWGEVAPLQSDINGIDTELLSDILDIAADGGTTWATTERMSVDKATGYLAAAQFTDCEDSGVSECVTLEKLANAIGAVVANKADISKELAAYIKQAVAESDASYIDVECADALVQIAAFGEIVYS